MKKIIYVYILVVAVLMLSCDHHHLYYATNNTAMVRVIIDWGETNLDREANEINKVSVIAYDSETGDQSVDLKYHTENVDTIYVALPEGKHDLIIFNNLPSDFSDNGTGRAIVFEGENNYGSYVARGVGREPVLTKNLPFDYTNRDVIKEPKALASCVLKGVEITREEIDIYYDRPEHYKRSWVEEFKVTPRNRTLTFNLHMNIKNTSSGAGKPPISFAHKAEGYYLGKECMREIDVRQEFNVNLEKWTDADNEDGYFKGTWLTFADFKEEDYSYELFTSFVLNNDSTKEFTKTLLGSDIIKDSILNDTYHIYWDVELPMNIGGEGGAFKPGAGDWDDVIVDL